MHFLFENYLQLCNFYCGTCVATSDYLSSVDTILLLLIAFLDLQYPAAGVRVLGIAFQGALQSHWLWQVSFCCKLVTVLSATNEIEATLCNRAYIWYVHHIYVCFAASQSGGLQYYIFARSNCQVKSLQLTGTSIIFTSMQLLQDASEHFACLRV